MCLAAIVEKDLNLSGDGYKIYFKQKKQLFPELNERFKSLPTNRWLKAKRTKIFVSYEPYWGGRAFSCYFSGWHIFTRYADAKKWVAASNHWPPGYVIKKVKYRKGFIRGLQYTIYENLLTLVAKEVLIYPKQKRS